MERPRSDGEKINHSCMFVSHDRFMINNIANRYMLIHDGRMREISNPDIYYALVQECRDAPNIKKRE